MLDKINEEIYRFWNEKGIEPNALMLGIEVINELAEVTLLTTKDCTKVSYVCGLPILCIDYCDTKMIKSVLI